MYSPAFLPQLTGRLVDLFRVARATFRTAAAAPVTMVFRGPGMSSRKLIDQFLGAADIRIGGDRPWDIHIHNDRFYERVLAQGTLGVGEAYMDGWWDADQLDETIFRLARAGAPARISGNLSTLLHVLRSRLLNLQTRSRSRRVAREHYDLGNDLYLAFLDPFNQYTCAYFNDGDDLNRAQENKLDLICRKLQLKPSDRVLDIGCGWGGFARWAAGRYQCHVTGLSISDEQIAYAKTFTAGLPVEIVKRDYRDISEKYDKVLICGMIEHVGYRNYRTIMEIVKRALAPAGLFLLQTIGRNSSATTTDPWIERYIFPNSMAPSARQLSEAAENLFIIEDWHNFGPHYSRTTLAWWRNFEAAWPKFRARYGERFYRMFRFYLLSSAGVFRARDLQLWQILFSPAGTTSTADLRVR